MVEITPKSSASTTVTLPEEGTYVARLYQVIHNGTTLGPYGYQTQCSFRFELPTELAVFKEENGEQPHAVTIPYINVSYTDRSSLFKMLKTLGIDVSGVFTLEDAIGKTCQITVSHKESSNGRTYLNAKPADVAPLLKGTKVPKQINDSRFFWIEGNYQIEWVNQEDKDGNPIVKKDDTGKVIQDADGNDMYEQKKGNVTIQNVQFTNEDILTEREREALAKTVEWNAKDGAELDAVISGEEELPF